MGIKHWPENERPREKLLHRGAGALSDAELLAILLRVGTQGMSAVDLARYLLQEFFVLPLPAVYFALPNTVSSKRCA